jgi:hypothetical protein
MRSTIAIVSAAAMLVAQTAPGFAQNALSTSVQPAVFSPGQQSVSLQDIVAAFDAFPKGGDQLSKRIADLIVRNPKLAVVMVKYVQATPGISREQKVAAEHGLADALTRLGIKAADMPVKALPAETWDYTWLLGVAGLAALGCGLGCFHHHDNPPPSPPLVNSPQ